MEADRAGQLKLDELSMQQKGNPSTVRSALVSNSGLAEQGEFLTDARDFYDPGNCEKLWIIPRSQSTHEYPESQRNDWPRSLLAA